jgi:pectinesterase
MNVRYVAVYCLVLAGLIGCVQSQAYPTAITVAQDGTGDFSSIQQAIEATKAFPDRPITITIGPGIYTEKVRVPHWNTRLTLRGAGVGRTVIRWDDHFKAIDRGRNSTFYTATVSVEADDFAAHDLTIENTAGPVGQAIALGVMGDRAAFSRVRIEGFQDTLYVAGDHHRVRFRDSYISGSVDFIFGSASAIFEQCHIHSRARGYVTAASTPKEADFGFVFIDSVFSAEPDVTDVFLGRPWRDDAHVAVISSQLGVHINAAGWNDWDRAATHATARFWEFNNLGPGANIASRAAWSRQLSPVEAQKLLDQATAR